MDYPDPVAEQAAEAERSWRRAASLVEAITADSPKYVYARELLALVYNNLGVLLLHQKRFDEALDALQKADRVQERLVQDFPDNVGYRPSRAHTLSNLGEAFRDSGRLDEALEALGRGLAICEKLVEEYPQIAAYRFNVSSSLWVAAEVLGLQGKWAEAAERLDRSFELMKGAPPPNPGDPQYGYSLIKVSLERADAYLKLGDHRGAARAIEELGPLALPRYTNGNNDVHGAIRSHRKLTECVALARQDPKLSPAERAAAATKYIGEARVIIVEAERRVQDGRETRHFDWGIYYQLAVAFAAGPIADFREPRRAIRAAEQGVEKHPRAAALWKILGLARYRAGDWYGAIEAVEKDFELRGSSGYAYEHTILAAAYTRKGEMDKAREWFAKLPPKFEPGKMADTPPDLYEEVTALLETKPAEKGTPHGPENNPIQPD
jgi:tetratricopeptide (TPR) repeat protein